jgi:hypothetical protein
LQLMSPTPNLEQHVCKSCQNTFIGIYCNQCGEKVLQPADRSFQKFLSNMLIAITFADSKFVKTLWLVIKSPGYVSFEFTSGRTVRYLKPISLFFVLNLVYFFFPVIQLFNASLNTQLLSPFSDLIRPIVAKKMVYDHLNLDSFAMIYNLKSVSLAKLLVMVFVVLSSLPLNFLYRKRNRYFTDHVGYAVELACFNLFINTMVLAVFASLAGFGHYLNETLLTAIFITTNLYFLIRSGRTFYGEKGWRLLLKSALMVGLLKVALEVYRLILFFVTIWSL